MNAAKTSQVKSPSLPALPGFHAFASSHWTAGVLKYFVIEENDSFLFQNNGIQHLLNETEQVMSFHPDPTGLDSTCLGCVLVAAMHCFSSLLLLGDFLGARCSRLLSFLCPVISTGSQVSIFFFFFKKPATGAAQTPATATHICGL